MVTSSENEGEIHDALIKVSKMLGAVSKDFKDKLKNKMKPSPVVCEKWIHRGMEMEDQVKVLVANYNQRKEGSVIPLCLFLEFKKMMMGMCEEVIDLMKQSNQMKALIEQLPEHVVQKKGPDVKRFKTLNKALEDILVLLEKENVKGIRIKGMMGIGKTNILLNLNNHEEVAHKFDIVIWLTVSKEHTSKNLSNELLQQATVQRLKLKMKGNSTVDEVARRISMKLEGKRYLLLLDDVKKDLKLSDIGIPDCNNGSKIVLTTSWGHVCSSLVQEVIKVNELPEEDAWLMFQDILGFENLDDDQKIAPLAWRVCRECYGLPLLIDKVANTFKWKKSKLSWLNGLNSWRKWPNKHCQGIKEVYELLKFCYDDLDDDQEKKCFLYSAIYPEDSDIYVDSLLEGWAAESLLDNDDKQNRAS
ncbi:hypothetical protein NMG60_11036683 [Bertholletia excelsa]